MKKTNVIFLTIDTLRADHLGCYGYFRDTTPNIDTLAADAVLFKDSFASAIATGPSYTCMFTGKANAHHGYYITPFNVPNALQMDDRIPTLPEVMLQNGYVTVALDNMISWRGHPKHFVRGFNFYVNAGQQPIGRPERVSSELITKRIIQWLQVYSREETPFFLFAHYWPPHTPYNQPEPYRTFFKHRPGDRADLRIVRAAAGYDYVPGWGPVDRMVEGESRFFRPYYDSLDETISIDLYDGATRYIDSFVGEVLQTLKSLGLYEDSLIILASDHGEALGQHHAWTHGTIYDHTIHVPLIIRHPDLPQGAVVQGLAQHIDLFPTIREMTGAREWPDFTHYADNGDDPSLDGESLAVMAAGGPPVRSKAFFEGGVRRGIRTGRWKLIADFGQGLINPPTELYDVAADPMETQDLSAAEPRLARELTEDLVAWLKGHLKGRPDPARNNPITYTCEVGELKDGFYR